MSNRVVVQNDCAAVWREMAAMKVLHVDCVGLMVREHVRPASMRVAPTMAGLSILKRQAHGLATGLSGFCGMRGGSVSHGGTNGGACDVTRLIIMLRTLDLTSDAVCVIGLKSSYSCR